MKWFIKLTLVHTISSVAFQGLKRCHEMVYKADTRTYISSEALQGLKSCHEMVYKADTSTYNFKCSITRPKKLS